MTSTETFETYRTYLFSIAYRMLGSAMDAEDMVQEAYLRYRAAEPGSIRSLKAFLTTILTRLCIDQLHLAYRQRETYLGPWLPEPINTGNFESPGVEESVAMRESLSLAFLTMLEELQPLERAVLLLREVFDYDYADISAFVGKSQAACRQMFSRARKRLAERASAGSASPPVQQQLLKSFVEAVEAGNTAGLMELLTEDAVLIADGGGKVPGASIHPVIGQAQIAQFAVGVNRRFLPAVYRMEMAEVNYQPAIVVRAEDRALVVMTVEVSAGRVRTVRFMANPDKLARL